MKLDEIGVVKAHFILPNESSNAYTSFMQPFLQLFQVQIGNAGRFSDGSGRNNGDERIAKADRWR